MFSRLSVASVLALSLLAAATPAPVADKRWGQPTTSSTPPVTKTVTVTATSTATQPASSCSTGPIQCCESTTSASSPSVTTLLGLLGVVLSDLDVLVGLTCSPVTVVGVGSGSECSANAVCCENNSFGSLISIGCVPVIL